jgi:hypothetical protein
MRHESGSGVNPNQKTQERRECAHALGVNPVAAGNLATHRKMLNRSLQIQRGYLKPRLSDIMPRIVDAMGMWIFYGFKRDTRVYDCPLTATGGCFIEGGVRMDSLRHKPAFLRREEVQGYRDIVPD